MKNKALEDIKNYAVSRLKQEYGYAGLADSDSFAMVNSGGEDENITIKIEHKTE